MGERSYIDSVHRQVDPEWNLHKQAMTGVMGTSGTPDYYYEAFNWYVWIEYKYVENLPRVIDLTDRSKKYSLSALQNRWLDRAYKNRTRAAAVLGSKQGAIIFYNGAWNTPFTLEQVEEYQCIVKPYDVAHFAAGFDNHRVVIKHDKDAGVQHEHASPGLSHWFPTQANKR